MKIFICIFFSLILSGCSTNNTNNMGFFDKLFGKNNSQNEVSKEFTSNDATRLEKTAEMLDEEVYWSIIDKSLKNTSNQDDQLTFLIEQIEQLTSKQMIGFRLRTDKLLYDTYNSEMWCAGYIMNGGCSDDAFEYFRNWIISRGKETYYNAKQNPDNLIYSADETLEFYDFELFWYVALEAFKNKTRKDLYDYIDNENFKTKEGQYPPIEFNWKEEDPETMKKICPRLYEKFWR